LELIISLGAACAVIAGLVRWLGPRFKSGIKTFGDFKAAVLGREAVVHPETGKELAPAQPGLGTRVASIEVAVTELVRVHGRLNDHESRIGRLELAEQERALARTETVELLRVVDTALRTNPPEEKP
jgi:hypothetical protein